LELFPADLEKDQANTVSKFLAFAEESEMSEKHLNEIRGRALARIDKSERNFKLGIFTFAVLDSLFVVVFMFIMDWSNKLHQLLFISTGGFYLLIILGLIVLGLHVRRDTQLVLKAIDSLEERLTDLRE